MEIDYLLGRMDEDTRAGFQARILEDEEAFARVAEVENELFDAYARGSLPAEWKPAFERTLLKQPEADRKLAVARKLISYRDSREGGGLRVWLAVAAAVIAIFGALLYTGREAPAAVVLRLPAIERGTDAIPVYELGPGQRLVELVVGVPPGPPRESYGAVLTSRDAETGQWSSVKPDQRELRFRISASKLPEGAYLLTVRDAAGPVSFHEFRVRVR